MVDVQKIGLVQTRTSDDRYLDPDTASYLAVRTVQRCEQEVPQTHIFALQR